MRSILMALGLTLVATIAVADGALSPLLAQHMGPPQSENPQKDAMTPEERMNRRFPQPVRVGDLKSLRVLDDQDVTIGFVRKVVRTPQGKILLLVSQGGWLGWGERLVAVPIEVMAIFGRQLASLDMEPKEYASASTWVESGGTPIPDGEIIRIALTKR
jgi:PRC-barrel domain